MYFQSNQDDVFRGSPRPSPPGFAQDPAPGRFGARGSPDRIAGQALARHQALRVADRVAGQRHPPAADQPAALSQHQCLGPAGERLLLAVQRLLPDDRLVPAADRQAQGSGDAGLRRLSDARFGRLLRRRFRCHDLRRGRPRPVALGAQAASRLVAPRRRSRGLGVRRQGPRPVGHSQPAARQAGGADAGASSQRLPGSRDVVAAGARRACRSACRGPSIRSTPASPS